MRQIMSFLAQQSQPCVARVCIRNVAISIWLEGKATLITPCVPFTEVHQ